MRLVFITAPLAATAMASALHAQTLATADTDVNIRSGPGVQHAVTGSIKSGAEVVVRGCIDSVNWCEVVRDGQTGWAYGKYLTASSSSGFQSITPEPDQVEVTVIEKSTPRSNGGQNAAVGSVAGAAMGAIIGGPVGAVAGATLGGTSGAVATEEPAPEIHSYVTTHRVETVPTNVQVAPGAVLPETVPLYDIPEHPSYRYTDINGQTVLVNPYDRQIVYIYR